MEACTLHFQEDGVQKVFRDVPASLASSCSEESLFYFQTPCLIPPKRAGSRWMMGLVIGCVGVFVYLFILIYFEHLGSVQENKFLDYDVRTITAGDYSV